MARARWSVLLVVAGLAVAVGVSDARHLLGPAPYLQCGGRAGECKAPNCIDAAWPAFKCPGDFVCGRINEFYWQCDKPKSTVRTGPPTGPEAGKLQITYKPTDFKQCGGTTGCKGVQCRDAVWPGTPCAAGLTCYKVSPFYYTCDIKPPKKTEAPTAVRAIASFGNAWKQCGGADAPTCTGAGKAACKDAPWGTVTCPPGFDCYRSNAYYWGCRTGPVMDGSG